MKDTPVSVMELWRKGIESVPATERIEMACSMFEFSRDLVVDSIRNENPNITEPELRRKLFLRFYGNDFDSVAVERILQTFEDHRRSKA